MKTTILTILLSCIGFSQPYTYEIDYQGFSGAMGNRTKVTTTIGCETFCKCPEDKTGWLTLTAAPDPNNVDCPTGCVLTYQLDIPSRYNCFTKYTITD
jgi:hypothetical protein